MQLSFINVGWMEMTVLLIPILFVIYTLYNVLNNRLLSTDKKILWVLVVFLFNVIGSVIYWVVGRESTSSR